MSRLGDKSKHAKDIICYFPNHSIYIEPFFGSGGMYFNKTLSSMNVLNDLDDNIYALWETYKYKSTEFLDYLESIPVSESCFEFLKNLVPTNNLEKAIKLIYLQNFSLFGSSTTFMSGNMVKKETVMSSIKTILNSPHLQNATFQCKDFKSFLESLSFLKSQIPRAFIYCDPPYLNKKNNYETPKWTRQDLIDLVQVCKSTQCKFAISEFLSDETSEIFQEANLKIHKIKDRRNIKNVECEIIATNYQTTPQILDLFK